MTHHADARPGNAIVAIPARNEADRIATCLHALNHQTERPAAVVLLVNNSTDETETITRALRPAMCFDLHVLVHDLPASIASAGHARRIAMNCAAVLAGANAGRTVLPGTDSPAPRFPGMRFQEMNPAGMASGANPAEADTFGADAVLLTTDGDSEVPPDWIALNLRAIAAGADIVCGRAVLDERDAARLPAPLRLDEATEARLISLLDSIAWLLDPEPHDPALRHTEASGASLAVTATAFHRVGGIPPVTDGEDRDFVRALWMMDAKVRHDPAIAVTVSGRLDGRAAAGMAATLRRRMLKRDELADPCVEPAMDACRRYGLRRRVRLAWTGACLDRTLAHDLGVAQSDLGRVLDRPFFGAAWAALEAISPVLHRRRVRFAQLPFEISVAQALLRRLATPEILAAD